MKPIITDSNSFPHFRENGAVYVDKTAQFHRLITNVSSRNYFIARPRRFGKSLMISTLEAIFKGKRELFKGLAIDSLPYDWEEYPVLRFDFSNIITRTVDEFYANFAESVLDVLEKSGCDYNAKVSPGMNFGKAIESLSSQTEKKVVVLIDEYDAPVGHSLDDIGKAEQIRSILSDFYIQIKAKNEHIRFMMMTGVSKFTQLSVFSALNNLTDLTIDEDAADLLGYSDDDLERYFGEHMRAHAEKMGVTYETYRSELRRWSDGYRFSPDSEIRMYNPFAIANTLSKKFSAFKSTWAATGRPSFLGKYLNRKAFLEINFESVADVSSSIFDAADLHALKPETILYQSGYLTIKSVDEFGYMTLGIPNNEIRQDLNSFILEVEAGEDRSYDRDRIAATLLRNDFSNFEPRVKSFYAGLPYGSYEKAIRQSEFSYVRIFIALLNGAGFELRPEDTQTSGRADLVAKGPKGTYIFEFKVDKSAGDALEQIKAKDYAAPFRSRNLPIFAIGINFDSETAKVRDIKVEEI